MIATGKASVLFVCTGNICRSPTAQARKRGYDISGLRARQRARGDFESFDLVLAMDRGHLQFMARLFPPEQQGKLRLLLDFAGIEEADVVRRSRGLRTGAGHGRGRLTRPGRPCPDSLVARFDLNELRLGGRLRLRLLAPWPAQLHRFRRRHRLPCLGGVGLDHLQSGA